jgi:tetratricopeptide (TPR) repeat protein/tRNA A-37 threonylcarbamoyl transferase component Bud32
MPIVAGSPRTLVLERFRLESVVGRGGSGVVYSAIDEATGERVAVKRLHKHLVGTVAATRFAREAHLIASVHSPHVVRFVAFGTDARGTAWLALEWLGGRDLGKLRRERRLTRAEVFDVLHQSSGALAALHEAGIVHRDVKPGNFQVTDEAGPLRLSLIDFGIARGGFDNDLTVAGMTLGTPSYMAPEQARGEVGIGPAADVFGLGVMYYELATGRRPFVGSDVVEVVAKIVLGPTPRLREADPDADPAFDALLAKAMAKEPEDRFANAIELAAAIAELPAPPAAEARRPPVFVDDTGSSTQSGRTWLSESLEQRVVTALFADATHASAEDAARFATIGERHGAAVHGLLGRRSAAVFGAHGSRGDEVARAARAAEEARALAGVRLAIVTGQAVPGGGALTGGVIERGLRELERATHGVALDEPSARLLSPLFVVEGPVGDRRLGHERALEDASAPRLLGQSTPLVGRDRELGALVATFEQCASEPVARAVLVTGPAGAGKSRLRYELLRRLDASGPPSLLLFGRGNSLAAGSPFGLLTPAVRRMAGILDGEPLEAQRTKLASRLALTLEGADHARVTAFVGELAGVPFPDDAHETLRAARQQPVLLGDAMRTAFEDFIAAEARRGPVLVVLEDLHWGDRPSVLFVDAILRNLKDAPVMVLATARPEVKSAFPDLWEGRDLDELRLAALTKRACEQLVRHALGDRADGELTARLVERAGGNPFYLEELIRAVAEGADADLPPTVLGMVQARLDALGPAARRVLRAASLFGTTFWRGGLGALLGDTDPLEVDAVLERLVARELVAKRGAASVPGETELVFRHTLVRDVAYAMLAEVDREVGHRVAGEWLESVGSPDALALAEHFALGGLHARAVDWYLAGARQALEGNDLAAVIERVERGVACGAEGVALGRLRLLEAEARRWRGELGEAEERGVAAMAEFEVASADWLGAASEIMGASGLLGHVDRIAGTLAAVVACDVPDERASLRLACMCRGAIWLLWTGRHAEADAHFERIEATAGDLHGFDHQATALVHFVRAARALHDGDPLTHLVEQRQALAAFERAGDARNACARQVAVGFAHAELGEYAEAEGALRKALAAAERMGIHNIVARALNNLGYALGRSGQLEEARAVEERAVEATHAQGDPRLEAGSRIYFAEILLARGEVNRAEREAFTATTLKGCTPKLRAVGLATQARALLALGRVPEAVTAAREAAAVADSLGRLDEGESNVRLALALALRAAGHRPEALAVLERARESVLARAARIDREATRAAFLAIAENAQTLALCDAWARGAEG